MCNVPLEVRDRETELMETHVTLPKWLDDYIFNKLGAKYCRSKSDMTVIDWDKSDMLNYLGTYFPRSYAEARCIIDNYLKQNPATYRDKETISILDFGCGTGGEIIGLITVLSERLPHLNSIKISPIDGNRHALELLDRVIEESRKHFKFHINCISSPVYIEDFYDLRILNSVLKGEYDIIISFKAICEFVTRQQFEKKNAYEHIASALFPKLSKGGLFLLVDVTTYNGVSKEWLPMMLDRGLVNAKLKASEKNDGYSQPFIVTHSHKINDISKIAWRLVSK